MLKEGSRKPSEYDSDLSSDGGPNFGLNRSNNIVRPTGKGAYK